MTPKPGVLPTDPTSTFRLLWKQEFPQQGKVAQERNWRVWSGNFCGQKGKEVIFHEKIWTREETIGESRMVKLMEEFKHILRVNTIYFQQNS